MRCTDADPSSVHRRPTLPPSTPFRKEECDHIIEISKTHMERSGVVAEEGGSEISDIRTSNGVFLNRAQDGVVRAIEERIAAWTLMPVGNGEGLQVLKYDPSEKYDAHWCERNSLHDS